MAKLTHPASTLLFIVIFVLACGGLFALMVRRPPAIDRDLGTSVAELEERWADELEVSDPPPPADAYAVAEPAPLPLRVVVTGPNVLACEIDANGILRCDPTNTDDSRYDDGDGLNLEP